MPLNAFKDEQILSAAITLLGEQGIGVATAKIAKFAEVSNGTLFNYYPTKQALLDKVYLSIKQDVSAHVIDDVAKETVEVKDFLSHLWQRYILWAIAHPQKQQVASLLRSSLVISEEVLTAVDKTFHFINARLAQAQTDKQIKVIPTEFLCEIAAAQMLATIQHARQHKLGQQQLNALIQQSFDIYWRGIRA